MRNNFIIPASGLDFTHRVQLLQKVHTCAFSRMMRFLFTFITTMIPSAKDLFLLTGAEDKINEWDNIPTWSKWSIREPACVSPSSSQPWNIRGVLPSWCTILIVKKNQNHIMYCEFHHMNINSNVQINFPTVFFFFCLLNVWSP